MELRERVARVVAEQIVAQNRSLQIWDDGTGYFDDYDNKNYECLPVADAILAIPEIKAGLALYLGSIEERETS